MQSQNTSSVFPDTHNKTNEAQKIPSRNCFSTTKIKNTKFTGPSEEILREWRQLQEERRRQYALAENEIATESESDDGEINTVKRPEPPNEPFLNVENIAPDGKTVAKLNYEFFADNKKQSDNEKQLEINTKKLQTKTLPDALNNLSLGSAKDKENIFKQPKTVLVQDKQQIKTKNDSLVGKMTHLSLENNKCSSQVNSKALKMGNKSRSCTDLVKKEPKVQFSLDVRSLLQFSPNESLQIDEFDTVDHLTKERSSCNRQLDLPDSNNSNSDSLKCKPAGQIFKIIDILKVEYFVLNVLGKGGSSMVYHCYEPVSKEEFAVKCVDLKQDKKSLPGLLKEVDLLKRLQNCDRIIKLHAFELNQAHSKLYMILEKGGSDFSQILRDYAAKKCHVPPFLVAYYWRQMLYAVQQIHAHQIIHSDLKPANFLVHIDRMKLIDFGISCCVDTDMTSAVKNIAFGTFSYISPEALCCENSTNINSPNFGKTKFKLSFRSDVWSLGCILYQLVYGRTPFSHITHSHAKLLAIMDPNHAIAYPAIERVNEKLILVIRSCLQFNAKSRPTVGELIKQLDD